MGTPWVEDSFALTKQNNMKIKTENLKWIPSVLITTVIAIGACMKLAGVSQLTEIYQKIGLLPFMKVLALSELLFIAIYLNKGTTGVGLLLLTGYFGGAMAVELSHGTFFIVPAAILSIIWIGAFLRDPSLFGLNRKIARPTHHQAIFQNEQ
jgi:hypothetical protein